MSGTLPVMAKKVILIDDITGEEVDPNLGGGTIFFEWDGERYAIDLGVKSKDKYTKMIQPLIEASRRPSPEEDPLVRLAAGRRNPARPKLGTATKAPGRSPEALADIRRWAKENGHEVAEKGRIAASVVEAYEAAH